MCPYRRSSATTHHGHEHVARATPVVTEPRAPDDQGDTPVKTPKKPAPSTKRLELEREVVADLEATDAESDSIRGGANYTRAVSGAL